MTRRAFLILPFLVFIATSYSLEVGSKRQQASSTPSIDLVLQKYKDETMATNITNTTDYKEQLEPLLPNEDFKHIIHYLNLETQIDEILTILNVIRTKSLEKARKEFCYGSSQHEQRRRRDPFIKFEGIAHIGGIFGNIYQMFDDGTKNKDPIEETTTLRTTTTKQRGTVTTTIYNDVEVEYPTPEWVQWAPSNLAHFPQLSDIAVKSGYDENGVPTWVTRFTITTDENQFYGRGSKLPGNLKMGNAKIGQPPLPSFTVWRYEYTTSVEFDVLVAPPHTLRWMPFVRGGHLQRSERRNWLMTWEGSWSDRPMYLYVGRCVNKHLRYRNIPGALHVYEHDNLGAYNVYVAYNGKEEVCYEEMEVLTNVTSLALLSNLS